VVGRLAGTADMVAHNAPFERLWIREELGHDVGLIEDTLVMSRVLYGGTDHANNRRFSHGLASVVKRELGVDLPKDEQTSDWSQPELTDEQLMYAARDAKVLPELARRLLRKIEEAGLNKVYELEKRVAHAVDAMERNGFAVDEEMLQAFIDATTARAEQLKAELEPGVGHKPRL
jgi:DNA polymerase-1